ncbi:Fic/DOC family protein [Commensalibacter nepenthis]|uniref:protein adenylyltransferase n=1 Tax=Commensalibacter nepenthis TaxID=3043872 RepID=A0ABT6Q495_9PROT|nr:Fic family protein [Commensalibacter sp. TBRC 10068]MDI2111728.1 Fic family protein [Commensalibacter sp. TBRC 10068]
MDDPYIDKKTGILKNKVKATTQEQLSQIEIEYSGYRIEKLAKLDKVYGNFDLAHSRAIHKTIFQDVYPWAGEVRKVNISKGDTAFAHNEFIESSFNKLSNELKKENYLRGSSPDKFAERAAYYMGEINMIHPFREGNGRTQRLFINDLAKVNGYEIDLKKMGHAKEAMIEASISAEDMDYAPLTKLIRDNLVKLDKPIERIDPTQTLNKTQPTKQQSKTVKTLDKPKQEPDIER